MKRKKEKYILHQPNPFFWASLVFLFGMLLTASRLKAAEWSSIFAFLGNNAWVAILTSSSVAGIIAWHTIATSRKTSKEKNALDFERCYSDSQKINDSWGVIATKVRVMREGDLREIANKKESEMCVEEKSIVDAIRVVLNEWERASNAMNHDIYDENLIYKSHAGNVIRLYEVCLPYIEERQRLNNRILLNLSSLALRWKLRRAREDGVKFSGYYKAKRYSQALKAALRDI
ncbi:DUF4760 domain-containing protein [Halomonas sp. BC04]|uniref:DUF4760 domain-containing protein n=1 Tax=Halomonas sp. BC04 TaxID=1403540 RepID=UPI0009DE12D8|nr:DUF4760 domain-containing protein [Halomonas sp. BC04]